MKKKGIIFIVVACMLFSGIAWGQEVSNQALVTITSPPHIL